MRRTPRSFILLPIAAVFVSLAPLAAQSDPPLPTDGEVSKYIAIWSALAGNPANAHEVCGLSSDGGAEAEDRNAGEAGRMLEASPGFGPLLRRHGITGARFVEVNLQIFGGMLGLAYADDLDATARERGLAATNRQSVIRDSPEARVVAKHEAALEPVMARAGALCSEEEDEDDGSYDEEE